MSVSHALISAVSGTDEQVPGLLEVLAQVTNPRRERGRRFTLVLVLAVAAVCVLQSHPFDDSSSAARSFTIKAMN